MLMHCFSYDGDENAGSQQAQHAAPVESQPAPTDTSMTTNDAAPGYGEEPEIAYDPTSFEVESAGQEDSTHATQSQTQNRDQDKVEKRSQEPFGLNMKEDG